MNRATTTRRAVGTVSPFPTFNLEYPECQVSNSYDTTYMLFWAVDAFDDSVSYVFEMLISGIRPIELFNSLSWQRSFRGVIVTQSKRHQL